MIENVCKKCGSKEHKKYGFVRGLQRYKCKDCGCNYTLTKARGIDPRLKAFSVVLYDM